MKQALLLGLIAWLAAGCSGRRLPPGTPPPEYEPPLVTPWPAENADAGADAAPVAPENADPSSPPAREPELSLDAGSR